MGPCRGRGHYAGSTLASARNSRHGFRAIGPVSGESAQSAALYAAHLARSNSPLGAERSYPRPAAEFSASYGANTESCIVCGRPKIVTFAVRIPLHLPRSARIAQRWTAGATCACIHTRGCQSQDRGRWEGARGLGTHGAQAAPLAPGGVPRKGEPSGGFGPAQPGRSGGVHRAARRRRDGPGRGDASGCAGSCAREWGCKYGGGFRDRSFQGGVNCSKQRGSHGSIHRRGHDTILPKNTPPRGGVLDQARARQALRNAFDEALAGRSGSSGWASHPTSPVRPGVNAADTERHARRFIGWPLKAAVPEP